MNNQLYSGGVIGIEAYKIEIEIDNSLNNNSPFHILGFSGSEIKNSKERILKAISNSGLDIGSNKFTINLYPYNPRKDTPNYDLPIAIGLLISCHYLCIERKFINETLFIGQLGLEGQIRPVKGILPIALAAEKLKIKRLIIPQGNVNETAVIDNLEIIGVDNLKQLISYLNKEIDIKPAKIKQLNAINGFNVDFKDIKGHLVAKRAFQIAAAGKHNIIMVGTPGSGKTMLAQRLPTIMPPMNKEEIIETSKVYSISHKTENNIILNRPFRDPHHSASQVGLIGGGLYQEPGEISLAHNGILFMDEFAEFKRTALEALRQPLESGTITISRANNNVVYPASFLLVAALNPCPCGYSGSADKKCLCNNIQKSNYFDKISGPLLDRIDMQLQINSVNLNIIQNEKNSLDSSTMKLKVLHATNKQFIRQNCFNGVMSVSDIEKNCVLTDDAKNTIKLAFEKLSLSSRSYHKILKISRTIADLDNSELIENKHIKEALMYRSLDHKFKE